MKKINLLIIFVLISFQVNSETTYIYKLKSNTMNNVQELDSNGNRIDNYDINGFFPTKIHKDTGTIYDPNGFDINGYDVNGFDINNIHKDTGTIYDLNGYDKDGYDINGYGIKTCRYDSNNYFYHYNHGNFYDWRISSNTSIPFSFDLSTSSTTYADKYYSRGTYISTNSGGDYYEVCKQKTKN